jgi:ankyrin repeat protein
MVKNFINENGQQVLTERDEDGFTPMHWAAFDGSLETFK